MLEIQNVRTCVFDRAYAAHTCVHTAHTAGYNAQKASSGILEGMLTIMRAKGTFGELSSDWGYIGMRSWQFVGRHVCYVLGGLMQTYL